MKTRIAMVVGIASLGVAASSHAQSTVFDFEGLGDGQSGSYEAEDGAVIADGIASTAKRPDWQAPSHTLRLQLSTTNPDSAAPGAVTMFTSRILPSALREAMRSDGRDVVIYPSDGQEALGVLPLGDSFKDGLSPFFVKHTVLAAGDSSQWLYAGGTRASAMTEVAFLTNDDPTIRYFAGSFGASDLMLMTWLDTTFSDASGTHELGAMSLLPGTVNDLGTIIATDSPVAGALTGAGGDAVVPESFAGKHFVIPAPRYDEGLAVFAPYGAATLTFETTSTPDTVIPAGEVLGFDTLAGNGEAIVFSSDAPVVVVRGSAIGDVTPMPPASRDVVGVGSGTIQVAAGADGATLTVLSSSAAMQTLSVPPNGTTSVGGGSQGTGPAYRITSDHPIGAITYGDGDGGEAVALLPPALLGPEFAIPFDAQFVAISAIVPETTCSITDSGGLVRLTASSPASVPGHIYFGATSGGANVPGPSYLTCDAPVWALFEEAASDAEKLLIAARNHRPWMSPEITIDAGSEIQTVYPGGTTAVMTPTFTSDAPLDGISTFETTSEGAISWQISFDGESWLHPADGALVEAENLEGAPAEEFVGLTFEGSTTVRFRALLTSDGIAPASVDELAVGFTTPAVEADGLRVGMVGTQTLGQPFTLPVAVINTTSGEVARVDGEVRVMASPEGIIAEKTSNVVDGHADITLVPDATGEGVVLTLAFEELTASTAPFDVIGGGDSGEPEPVGLPASSDEGCTSTRTDSPASPWLLLAPALGLLLRRKRH